MQNADLARIINSTEVQSVLRPKLEPPTSAKKANALKNKARKDSGGALLGMFRVQGLGFGVWGFGFIGLRAHGLKLPMCPEAHPVALGGFGV